MRILIVGKTRMRNDIVCIGGWDLDNNVSVRLLTANGHNHPINTPYELGDIWEIECRRRQNMDPPHVEDVLVTRARHIGRHPRFPGVIDALANVHRGSIEGLYERLLQFPGNGTGFISRQTGIPAFSTQFWRTDADLVRNDFGTKVRYRYEGRSVRNVTYVGFQDPVFFIPQGTLVRMSLARWYEHGDAPNPKCYLQLSGWFLP